MSKKLLNHDTFEVLLQHQTSLFSLFQDPICLLEIRSGCMLIFMQARKMFSRLIHILTKLVASGKPEDLTTKIACD